VYNIDCVNRDLHITIPTDVSMWTGRYPSMWNREYHQQPTSRKRQWTSEYL